MPAGIFKVCLVVIATIVNHPLLFPKENVTENTEGIIQKMKEREESLRLEQLKLEQEMAAQETLTKSSEKAKESEEQYTHDPLSWNFWTALSLVVFLLIELWRQDYQEGIWQDYGTEEDENAVLGKAFKWVLLPDKITLANFYERCIQNVTSEIARNRELVEGFADDLLEALRSVCNRDADMEVEESIGIGSMYENWRVQKPLACDFIVPFTPPEPYCFKLETWDSGESIPPDKQGYGMIKICQADETSTGCICDKTKLGEDLLCLLHSKMNQSRHNNHMENLLCYKDSQYLDSDQVMAWFQVALTKAWNKISHKYEFNLTFNLLDSPGALKIKFRSGKTIAFNLTPVVQYADSDVYFISHFPCSGLAEDSTSSIHWFLTFAVYEKRNLPEELGIPVAFQKAEPMNLFRPFVLQRSAYRKTMDMFHEMLRNTSALINEYTMHVPMGRASPLNKELL
uniref:Uncharacterized protein n=1 Tax=Sphaerodactylus townsendi TaxID=933632 RepID=A0ACB8F9B4_9SAUR